MKKVTLIVVMAAIAFSATTAIAENIAPVDKGPQARQNTPNITEFDKQMQQAQESLKLMQAQMDRISQTLDMQERQKLLQEHWTTMQHGMGMMRGMWGWELGMMGCCAGGPMMGGHMMGWQGMHNYYSKLTPEQMKQRQYMMDQYMGMQQMMMDQMMQHQNYMWMQQPR